MIAVSIAMAIWTALLVWMQVRTEKRRELESDVIEEGHGQAGERGGKRPGVNQKATGSIDA